MPTIKFENQAFPVDADGFLTEPGLWGPEWVEHVRRLEDIDELDEDHWTVIQALRAYRQENGRAPKVSDMASVTGFKLKYIYELFPSGPGQGACKMAGLDKPEGCV